MQAASQVKGLSSQPKNPSRAKGAQIAYQQIGASPREEDLDSFQNNTARSKSDSDQEIQQEYIESHYERNKPRRSRYAQNSSGDDGFCMLMMKVFIIFIIFCIVAILAYPLLRPWLGEYLGDSAASSSGKKQVTAILHSLADESQTLSSLNSLLAFNKGIEMDIVVLTSQLSFDRSLFNIYENLMVISYGDNRPLRVLDEVLKGVKTQYYLYMDTDWLFMQQGYIKKSMQTLRQLKQVSQVEPGVEGQQLSPMANEKFGFSFKPSLHRVKDYKIVKQGFSRLTEGIDAKDGFTQKGEIAISEFYLSANLYCLKIHDKYVKVKPYALEKYKQNENQRVQYFKTRKYKSPSSKSPTTSSGTLTAQQRQQQKQNHFSLIMSDLNEPTATQGNWFLDRKHNTRDFIDLQSYLTHNQASKVLLVNCKVSCEGALGSTSSLSVVQRESMSNLPQLYDWIASMDIIAFYSTVVANRTNISGNARYGLSISYSEEFLNRQDIIDYTNKHLSEQGFHLEETKSAVLTRSTQKFTLVYLKGQSQSQPFPWLGKNTKANKIAIQTTLNIRVSIPYLREWMGYHLNLGVDKFFLYDVTDFDAEHNNNLNFNYECLGYSQQQVQAQWKSIWMDFYQHIVYVPWGRDQQQRYQLSLTPEDKAEHDYLTHFRHITQYTAFINVGELIFSADAHDLAQYLNFHQKSQVNAIILTGQYFTHALCNPYQRLTEMTSFLPDKRTALWDDRVIAVTMACQVSSVAPRKNIQGKTIVVADRQMRVNLYILEKSKLEHIRKSNPSAAQVLGSDVGTRRYASVIASICEVGCSEVFGIACPRGKEYTQCPNLPLTSSVSLPKPAEATPKPQPSPAPAQNPQPAPAPQMRQAPPAIYDTQYVLNLQRTLGNAPTYAKAQLLTSTISLPFCVVVPQSVAPEAQTSIIRSISQQTYPESSITVVKPSEPTYTSYHAAILQNCVQNTLVFFVNSPLHSNAISNLNALHNKFNTWVTYDADQSGTQIFSFYWRLFELLWGNDFSQTNRPLLMAGDVEVYALGLQELGAFYSKKIEKSAVYPGDSAGYFNIKASSTVFTKRKPYEKLIRLSQDYSLNTATFQNLRINFRRTRAVTTSQLTPANMQLAVDQQQSWYLPQGHPIEAIQHAYFNQKYKIDQYNKPGQQIRFCVTILSHNNIQNNRYLKVLKSTIMQKYQNYHIVFIDDNSTDSNMNSSIQYLREIGFPESSVTLVQNLRRNYATYNIINAAYNFCGEDDVQLLMDGDDEFIGRYAFQVMNAVYVAHGDLWVAYSNYKTNYYGYGRSRPINSDGEHLLGGVNRARISIFGAIRSWRVRALYNIPPLHHKMRDGQWLDTVYDDALMHPLFELSSFRRVKYVPQLLYDYNIKYGDNDDSTSVKIAHRSSTYVYITSLKPLQYKESLNGTIRNEEIVRELEEGRGVRYEQVQYE